MKKKIFLCQHYFNIIGGVETFIINFCKTFGKDYDITLLCRQIDFHNAYKISEHANIICSVPEEPLECDICIITSVLLDEQMINMVRYKKIYRMIHSDWSAMKNFWNWEFQGYDDEHTQYISVSDAAKDGFIKEYNKNSIVIPNLLFKNEVIKNNKNYKKSNTLVLGAFQRLTKEKGYDRIIQLADLLDNCNISYEIHVFGTNPLKYGNYKNIFLHNPVGNVQDMYHCFDYILCLSDTESFCYTMYESLMYGTPVIATPFPNALCDIKNGINGYIIPFDMKINNEFLNKIFNNIPKEITYEQKGVVELWKKLLN